MASFVSWNCLGLRTRLDFKSIVFTNQPACVVFQETFLKSIMTRVRGFNYERRDVDGNVPLTGVVCLFTSHHYSGNVVTLHTSLQAVVVQIYIHSLVTVFCSYVPSNDVVPQMDLDELISQLPALFILIGDLNRQNQLLRHWDANSHG
ncbi:RNA-directed DNA polymerase from mobile element jockey [Trichonephila clavipes]|nr:RNA-directed DNA polymerase from mobile element jockey [Trichonephila clavipes]